MPHSQSARQVSWFGLRLLPVLIVIMYTPHAGTAAVHRLLRSGGASRTAGHSLAPATSRSTLQQQTEAGSRGREP